MTTTQAEAKDSAYIAPQWKLVWWRFRKHRLALVGMVVIALLYVIAIFPQFLAIHDPFYVDAKRTFIPPQGIHFDGIRPNAYEVLSKRNLDTFKLEPVVDESKKHAIRLFARGFEYRFLGLFETNIHLLGTGIAEEEVSAFYPLGTDRLGRDMLSRLMYGTRVSMSIGLIGVMISVVLGILLGGISGYAGGWTDVLIQRVIEFLRAIPTIPLWMALAAAVPNSWTVMQVYFAIVVIISFMGWTTLAREIRGRFLAMREEDFVVAAQVYGASPLQVILKHMLPSFTSHIIATTTLAVPSIIIAETSLSFLGLGLRAPAVSWGVLLQDAQNFTSVALSPWLLVPGLCVIISVLAFNFMGDGLRDAADPYAN